MRRVRRTATWPALLALLAAGCTVQFGIRESAAPTDVDSRGAHERLAEAQQAVSVSLSPKGGWLSASDSALAGAAPDVVKAYYRNDACVARKCAYVKLRISSAPGAGLQQLRNLKMQMLQERSAVIQGVGSAEIDGHRAFQVRFARDIRGVRWHVVQRVTIAGGAAVIAEFGSPAKLQARVQPDGQAMLDSVRVTKRTDHELQSASRATGLGASRRGDDMPERRAFT